MAGLEGVQPVSDTFVLQADAGNGVTAKELLDSHPASEWSDVIAERGLANPEHFLSNLATQLNDRVQTLLDSDSEGNPLHNIVSEMDRYGDPDIRRPRDAEDVRGIKDQELGVAVEGMVQEIMDERRTEAQDAGTELEAYTPEQLETDLLDGKAMDAMKTAIEAVQSLEQQQQQPELDAAPDTPSPAAPPQAEGISV